MNRVAESRLMVLTVASLTARAAALGGAGHTINRELQSPPRRDSVGFALLTVARLPWSRRPSRGLSAKPRRQVWPPHQLGFAPVFTGRWRLAVVDVTGVVSLPPTVTAFLRFPVAPRASLLIIRISASFSPSAVRVDTAQFRASRGRRRNDVITAGETFAAGDSPRIISASQISD